ncbi:MAG: chromate transporter, partial [Terracidiphilus sp.]
MADQNAPSRLAEILRLFLRLGLTAFGGPAAHLALMQREAVERRGWLSRERFLDLVGACNLLPGPGSTQVAMALGYTRAGWAGLLVAGGCFILPAALTTLALAWGYVRFGSLPQTQGLLYGAKPVMVAIVAQAVWKLGRTAWRRWPLAAVGLGCL